MSRIVIVLLLSCVLFDGLVVAQAAKKPVKTEAQVKAAKKKAEQELNKLIDAVQNQYNNTTAASFDFKQTYTHPFLNVKETPPRGTVKYSRAGGKMLWSYLEPKNRQKKIFINGNKFTYYSLSDKVAYTHNCLDQETLPASVTFLLGRGNLRQSFSISFLGGETPNKALKWLSLIPKEKNSSVIKLLLGIDGTAKVVESLVEDQSGGKNHFEFINFKIVKTFPDSVFTFTPPSGVKIEAVPNVKCPTKQSVPKAPPTKKLPTGSSKVDGK
ncbi:MAG TPA: outer membrane lipoprotein carrier protein LolA [Myxococcota bacterium]|nr:outer membrane lipoprotein carrier protein LolA [Myxococcota bacterium]